ncbi:hypothetical protein HK099_006500 [Clydaea vesicula]|uniref:Uncharacterized protein n=1 Tax=Clydaea vesicula TaxID=447962 RepID=A0AAD5U140_9FUNG|nr:hypothetical protein HK099_006500 [Clydaea vesicula]
MFKIQGNASITFSGGSGMSIVNDKAIFGYYILMKLFILLRKRLKTVTLDTNQQNFGQLKLDKISLLHICLPQERQNSSTGWASYSHFGIWLSGNFNLDGTQASNILLHLTRDENSHWINCELFNNVPSAKDIKIILGVETFECEHSIQNIALNILPFPSFTPSIELNSIQQIIQNHRNRIFHNSCQIMVEKTLCQEHTSCLLFAIDMIVNIHGIEKVNIERNIDQFYVVKIAGYTTDYPFSIENSLGSYNIEKKFEEKVKKFNDGLSNHMNKVIIENETDFNLSNDNIFETFNKLYDFHLYQRKHITFIQFIKGNGRYGPSNIWIDIEYEIGHFEGTAGEYSKITRKPSKLKKNM